LLTSHTSPYLPINERQQTFALQKALFPGVSAFVIRLSDYGPRKFSRENTLKKSFVDPESTDPYLISVCLAKSSADSIGDCIRSTVKKAAKLAVYDDIIINVKNHQTLPTIRPDIDLQKIFLTITANTCE
jgi:hypothetical protein